MSDKKVPHPGDIFGHEAANVASVRALYPAQFSGPFNTWGWPDGWHSIVLEVCAFAAHHRPETRCVPVITEHRVTIRGPTGSDAGTPTA